jgi:hypothetical protein
MKTSELAGLIEVPISTEVVQHLLAQIPQDIVLVGGQALAFWVEHYQIDSSPRSSEDEVYVSLDADFLGHRQHVKMMADIVAGKTQYPPQRAMTILCGQIFIVDKTAQTFMNIDVIHRIGNMDSDAVRKRATTASVEGNKFLVMHPLDVLVSRVENYRGILDKRNRNGLRQIELSIEVASRFVIEAQMRNEAIALKAIEKIAETARCPAGVLARKNGANIYDAIQPDMLKTIIKNEQFLSIRLPLLIAEINKFKGCNEHM